VEDRVRLDLSRDEALVLFEFLSRFSNSNALAIEDQVEERALWNLLCLMERQMVEPFLPEYPQLIQQARERLRDRAD
jgi:hypothetical protein